MLRCHAIHKMVELNPPPFSSHHTRRHPPRRGDPTWPQHGAGIMLERLDASSRRREPGKLMELIKRPLRRLRSTYGRLTGPLRGLPSVLIIGTQKGGTTSLFNYVAEHPDVLQPIGKEVHYFDLHYEAGENWY